MRGGAVPDYVAFDYQVIISGDGGRHAAAGRCWTWYEEVLPLRLVAIRVEDKVVVDEHVAVGDAHIVVAVGDQVVAPTALGGVLIATLPSFITGLPIAGTPAEGDFDNVTARPDAVGGVVGNQDVVAAINAERRAFQLVEDVVDHFHIVGFVLQPRRDHELKACALSGSEAARAATVELIPLHTKVSRAAFGVHTPIA